MSVPKDHDGAWLLSEGPLSADLLKNEDENNNNNNNNNYCCRRDLSLPT